MKTITLFLLAAALVAAPPAANAQSAFTKDNLTKMMRKGGLHLNAGFRKPTDSDVSQRGHYGVSVGLSPGETNGWTYPVALSMFSETLDGPSGEGFAVLRSQSLLAGVGYGWHFGKLSTGASLQAGFSRLRVRPEGDVLHAFNLTSGDVFVHVKNAPMLRPQLKAEYFLTRKLTLRLSGDYVLMHPDITVEKPGGAVTDQWDASNFHANVGIGVYPFHK